MVGADGLPTEALSEILSECPHRVRFVSFDGRVEAGRIPIPSVRRLREVLRPHGGQIAGSVSANPHFLEEGLEAMELGVRYLGMRAIGKMIPYMEDWVVDEYRILPIARLAGDLDVPISFAVTEEQFVEGFIHLAESFPRTRFVMGHFVGRGWRFACRIVKQAKLSNLYLEIDVFPTPQQAKLRFAAAIDAAGIDRIVFGSDFCLRPGARYTAADYFLETLEQMKLKDGDIERICFLNAREMLRLDP